MLNDGYQRGTEECDDGDTNVGNGCHDGQVQIGYTCNSELAACDSSTASTDGKSLFVTSCGDNEWAANSDAEKCDDYVGTGQPTDGDGCSASCTIEEGFRCWRTDGDKHSTCGIGGK